MLYRQSAWIFLSLMTLFSTVSAFEIDERGFWVDEVQGGHLTDWKLAKTMTEFLHKENAESVVDFGCGGGDYVHYFLDHGLACEGYDGNPITPVISKGVAQVQDLSEPFYLGKQFDWVISLEVGEHLPAKYEKVFIENLMRHAKKGIIISWAVQGQGGQGHFNEQSNKYIKSIFKRYGYTNDVQAERLLRKDVSLAWFRKTIMVFRKP